MDVVVAVAAVGEAVDQPRVAVVGEDDRLVRGEERVELLIRHAVRMFGGGLQAHQVDDVDDADLEVRHVLAHQGDRSQGLQRGTSPQHAMTTSGSPPWSVARQSQMPMPRVQ